MQNITVLLALILVGLALAALSFAMKVLAGLLRIAAVRQDSILSTLSARSGRRRDKR